ncbi:TRAP transporter small permease [Arenibaculum pallidiluteum]|uniref:TRAP transporter small permease n=1 Tax=Arenibaculum pallidiluteum TaxID=2812559 RepID=UPI001A977910|nr:TRAP transporter small permease [Arenibaculum pallidiluteum]
MAVVGERAGAMPRASSGESSSILDRVEGALYRCEAALVIGCLVLMLVTICVSVAARYFALPLPNFGELATVAMAPLTFVGAALCTYLNGHIAVDFAQILPSAILRLLARAAAALSQLAFAGIFAYVAWEFYAYAVESGERLIDLGTPVAVPGAFMVAGSVLMAFHALADLYRIARGLPHPGRER